MPGGVVRMGSASHVEYHQRSRNQLGYSLAIMDETHPFPTAHTHTYRITYGMYLGYRILGILSLCVIYRVSIVSGTEFRTQSIDRPANAPNEPYSYAAR